jgi:uncharacterized Ntn-hydrolase superfamily protein
MTYSIVARDAETGQLGVAVQSRYFSVGSVVTWAEPGVGAVATQSFARAEYGPQGLALMREGVAAPEALARLVAADEGRATRQVAMVDAQGRAGVHTGERCIAAAGHIAGDDYSVQANMMVDDSVWPAMQRAYVKATGDLAERLLASLQAAQDAGGDVRGQQSAAIVVVSGDRREPPWKREMELRVEDHARPIEELARLMRLHRAYRLASMADDEASTQDFAKAAATFARAMELAPGNDELQFWAGIGAFRQGQEAVGEAMLRQAFTRNPGLVKLVARLVPLGMVRDADVPRIEGFARS